LARKGRRAPREGEVTCISLNGGGGKIHGEVKHSRINFRISGSKRNAITKPKKGDKKKRKLGRHIKKRTGSLGGSGKKKSKDRAYDS